MISIRRTLLLSALMIAAGLALGAGFAFKPTARDGKAMYRYVVTSAPFRRAEDARDLQEWLARNQFDIAGTDWQSGQIEVITNDEGVARLQQAGLRGFVRSRAEGGLNIDKIDERYLNSERLEAQLKDINRRFPQVTRLEQIGTSREGRPIWALLLSTTPNLQDPRYHEKPSVIFDGMHHAREIMTSEIVLDIAQTLLSAASRRVDSAISMIETWNIWIVPMLNVDGNNLVWTKDNWWRKNTWSEQGRIFGVDINRNYPATWNICNGSSASRTADDFRGPAAASEPETQALMRLAEAVRPAASLSYHSYGELVLYPYGCRGRYTGENELIDRIGKELAANLPSERGRGTYTPGVVWNVLYAVDGDSMSYMHHELGALAMTLEVNKEFQPAYSMRDPTLQAQRRGWQFFLNRLGQNMLSLQVVDGLRKTAAPAKVEISTVRHQYGEKGFQTNAAGVFHKVLDPGTYQLRVTLADGRTQTMNVQMTGQPQRLQVLVGANKR